MGWTGPVAAAALPRIDDRASTAPARLSADQIVQVDAKTNEAIRVERVAKRFGETQALADASLVALPGEIHAIVGENGSGKSTLAKILSGVVVPDAGEVSVFGTAPATPAEARAAGIATIFQEILVADQLTVTENVFAGQDSLWRRRMPEAEKRRQTAAILERLVGVPVDPDARVGALPLAVKQWIVIARALMARPRALIFDESSAALDLDATNRLHEEMLRLKAEGCAILLVTHRIAELVRIADACTLLRDGVTVGRLAKQEITEERILSMMGANVVEHGATVAASGRKAGDVVLSAQGVAIGGSGAPFDFALREGEIVGLAGLEGAGQTEFARVLAGIDAPAAGTLTCSGRAVRALADADAAGIGYVSGDRKREGIFPRLSILENFGIALMRRQARRGVIDTQAREIAFAEGARRLSLRFGAAADRITTLSGGNQQKVLIARAFAQTPRVIVLNDPARGVDIGTKQDLWRHLRGFAAQGGAVIYLSSEIEEFPGFADRVDVFVAGTISDRLAGADINEHRLLAALFGRKGEVEFDAEGKA